MLTIKNSNEIELMRIAGEITAYALDEVEKLIKPGISTKELESIAIKAIREKGATPSFLGLNGYPAAICVSVNEQIAHGIPSDRILKNGDIVSVDLGACYQGYHGDSARTFPCGNVTQDKLKLINVTKQSLLTGLSFARANNHLGDISSAIEKYIEENNCYVIKEYTGHGIGKQVHEDPVVPNFGSPNKGILLKEGMTLAIEPTVCLYEPEIELDSDGWTLKESNNNPVAHEELTILITRNGYEILTKYLKGELKNVKR